MSSAKNLFQVSHPFSTEEELVRWYKQRPEGQKEMGAPDPGSIEPFKKKQSEILDLLLWKLKPPEFMEVTYLKITIPSSMMSMGNKRQSVQEPRQHCSRES